jgi:membrane protease YdiL (CAAX protease family)
MLVRRHPVVAAVILLIPVPLLIRGYVTHNLFRAAVYLVVVAASVAIVDVLRVRSPLRDHTVNVRAAGIELLVASISYCLAMTWLVAHFVTHHEPHSPLLRLAWVTIGLGSLFNAGVVIVLMLLRTSATAFGFRVTGLHFSIVVVLFAVVALVFFPGSVTLREILRETNGVSGLAVLALSAAVPEEFFRFVWQTRVAALTRNPALGWLVASLLWALLHVPKSFAESHSASVAGFSMLNILPLGLLWGYMTHRAKSFLPAAILHATNVWGLQNLG